jgi:hypothetical protein
MLGDKHIKAAKITQEGSFMLRSIRWVMLLGIVALIISEVKIYEMGGLPDHWIELPDAREIMQIFISIVLLLCSLYVILTKKYQAKDQNWAYATIGTILGFWIK